MAVPVITSPTSATGRKGVPFAYYASAAPSNGILSYGDGTGRPIGVGFYSNTAGPQFSGTPTEYGVFHLLLYATNSEGEGPTTNITLTILKPYPVVTSVSAVSGQTGVPFSYQITASTAAGVTSYSATNLPPGLTVNTSTGVISGTPTQQASYQVILGASDSDGTGTAVVPFSFSYPALTITSPLSVSATAGEPFAYQITSTGTPDHFRVYNLPGGLAYDASTGIISGSIIYAGNYTFQIGADNQATQQSGSAFLHITVAPHGNTNLNPPSVTSGDAVGTVGLAMPYQITATNAPTSFGAGGLPDGLTLQPSSGLISGVPITAGVYSVTLAATNGDGTGSKAVAFTVTDQAEGGGYPDDGVENLVIQIDLSTGAVNLPKALSVPHGNEVLLEVQFLPVARVGTVESVSFALKEPVNVGFLQFPALLDAAGTSDPIDGTGNAAFLLGPVTFTSSRLDHSLTLLDPIALAPSRDYTAQISFAWNGRSRTSSLFPVRITRDLSVLAA